MARFNFPVTKVRVVDGDSLACRIDMGFRMFRDVNVRLYDIDTPEKTGKNKRYGKIAERAVECWLYHMVSKDKVWHEGYGTWGTTGLILNSYDLDKYGRILGDLIVEDQSGVLSEDKNGIGIESYCLTEYLLKNKLARPYKGGKRKTWFKKELKPFDDWLGDDILD